MALLLLSLLPMITSSLSLDQICYFKLKHLSEQLSQFPQKLPSNINDLSVVMFSGKGIYDMGSKEMCDLNPDLRYLLASPYQPSYMGICIYKECSTETLNELESDMVPYLPFSVVFYDNSLNDKIKAQQHPGFIATCIILAILLVCSIVGSLVQYTSFLEGTGNHLQIQAIKPAKRNEKQLVKVKNKWGRFFLSFSIPLNWQKLTTTEACGGQRYDPNLDIFAGVRTLSLMYIIFGHLVGTNFGLNFNQIFSRTQTWFHTFALGGSYAVDAFFCMSAFLCTYTLLNKPPTAHSTCLNFFYAYFHRWYRLAPTLAFVLLLNMFLFPFLVQGPVAVSFYYLSVQNCQTYWWPNLLFINNFYPWDIDDECLVQVWYLANDFQFFLILTFLHIILRLHKEIAHSINALLIVLSTVACLITAYAYHIKLPTQGGHYSNDYYTKPYCRLAAYMVGVVLAQLYHDRKQANQGYQQLYTSCGNRFFRLYERSTALGWISAILGFALTTFFIFFYKATYPKGSWGLFASMVWIAFSRPLFTLGLMLVLLPTFQNKLPWLKSFLSCTLFKVLGKLTYSAFLIHGVVIYAYFASEQNTEIGSRDKSAFLFFGIYSLVYIAAGVIYLLCELPLFNIEKLILFPQPVSDSPPAKSQHQLYLEQKYGAIHIPQERLLKPESETQSETTRSGDKAWIINQAETTKSLQSEDEIYRR